MGEQEEYVTFRTGILLREASLLLVPAEDKAKGEILIQMLARNIDHWRHVELKELVVEMQGSRHWEHFNQKFTAYLIPMTREEVKKLLAPEPRKNITVKNEDEAERAEYEDE